MAGGASGRPRAVEGIVETRRGRALEAEVGGVVVVGGWMHDQDQACAAMLAQRQVTVRLAAPLGDRIILDAATGQPVTQEPAPGNL